jgi:hypothetical protein
MNASASTLSSASPSSSLSLRCPLSSPISVENSIADDDEEEEDAERLAAGGASRKRQPPWAATRALSAAVRTT